MYAIHGTAGKRYAQFKKALADAVVEYLSPIRERYEQGHSEPEQIRDVLRSGAENARTSARKHSLRFTSTSVFCLAESGRG
jgi:tryptophanyl-tRNA synthetase